MLNATILLVREKLADIVAIEAMIAESGYKAITVSAVEAPSSLQNPENRVSLIMCHYSQKALFAGIQATGRALPFMLVSDAHEKTVLAPASTQKIAYLNQPFSKPVLKTLIDILVIAED